MREALTNLFQLSAQSPRSQERVQRVLQAEHLARLYERGWSDSFFVSSVEQFRRWSTDATKIALNTNTHAGTITMNFKTDVDDTDDQVCTDYTGVEGRRGDRLKVDVRKHLKSQLNGVMAMGGAFFLVIDKTDLIDVEDESMVDQHLLSVEYDGTFPGQIGYTSIRFAWVENATVKWVGTNPDVYEFTGAILVAAGEIGGKNGKRGRRAIACSSPVDGNLVRVTVVPV